MDGSLMVKNEYLERSDTEKFDDLDFERLEARFKNSCIVMVPESEIINFSMVQYLDTVLKQYDERFDIEPYIEASLEEVTEDFKEFEDSFDDIHEFCKKIYGGYIEGTNVMSTINYDAEWSYYKVMQTYNAQNIEKLNLPIKVKCIVDLNKKIHKKSNDESENEWLLKMNKLISNSNSDNNLFLAHIEYF